MDAISVALKRLGAKRMGWWLNKEWFIATDGGLRKLDMRSAEDRAAIRDAIRYFESTVAKSAPIEVNGSLKRRCLDCAGPVKGGPRCTPCSQRRWTRTCLGCRKEYVNTRRGKEGNTYCSRECASRGR